MTAATTSKGGFLSLPTELRYNIYDQLSPDRAVCYSFPNSPITSISHGAPPRQLLLTCREIYDEIRTYYYGRATFRLLALGSTRIKREDISLGTLAAIRQGKKVELMLMWNLAFGREKCLPAAWPWYMTGWLDSQVELLKEEGHNLEILILSLRDASPDTAWEAKKRLLEPLQKLKGKVRFEIGEIATADAAEGTVREDLVMYVRQLNGSGHSSGGT